MLINSSINISQIIGVHEVVWQIEKINIRRNFRNKTSPILWCQNYFMKKDGGNCFFPICFISSSRSAWWLQHVWLKTPSPVDFRQDYVEWWKHYGASSPGLDGWVGVGPNKIPPVFLGDVFRNGIFWDLLGEKTGLFEECCLDLDELLFVLVMMIIMLIILLFYDYHTCLVDIRSRKLTYPFPKVRYVSFLGIRYYH